jgi:hypothetical protein
MNRIRELERSCLGAEPAGELKYCLVSSFVSACASLLHGPHALDVLQAFVKAPFRGDCYICGPDQEAEALQAGC